MGCCLLWCTIAFSYLLSVPVCHYIKSSAIIVWHLLFPLFFFVCNYYLSVNVTWCHLLLSAITSYDLLLSAMFATIWCYILVLISIIFRGYLIADSICYCQLLSANIGYYLFCLLLSIIICSCLVTSIDICCFSSYLWLSFVSSSDLRLSTIVMLLSDIICCSWPISAIYLSIYSYSLHLFPPYAYYLALSATTCYHVLLSPMITYFLLWSVIVSYVLQTCANAHDYLLLSATISCYLPTFWHYLQLSATIFSYLMWFTMVYYYIL